MASKEEQADHRGRRSRPAPPRAGAAVREESAAPPNDRDGADLERIGRELLAAHDKWDTKRFASD